MKPKKEIKEELEKLSPFLADLDKEKNFQVPTNYFNELQEDLWKQVRPAPAQKPVVEQSAWWSPIESALLALFQPRMALSFASLLLLLTAGWFIMQQPTDTVPEVADNLPTVEEAADYLAEHIDDFDTELLMQLELDDIELSQISESSFEDDEVLDTYFDEMLDDVDSDELQQFL